ncbi:hypothetical protein GLOIN_2v440197 [Rhizophagus irregularis DAOM 181602=DAOM 197198]|nr:hypothetical protein GLOIN_2v440197 [Rhizophagus irregularis DAOM 181602=DAOM 197198]CAB4460850.1 unnamed protein product [Rhizophagus irregularis]
MSVWTHPFIWTPTANALEGGHRTPTRTHYDLYCNPLRFMNNSSGISFFFHDSDIESWSINVVLDHLAKMEINLTPEEFLDKYKAQLISLSSQYGNSRILFTNVTIGCTILEKDDEIIDPGLRNFTPKTPLIIKLLMLAVLKVYIQKYNNEGELLDGFEEYSMRNQNEFDAVEGKRKEMAHRQPSNGEKNFQSVKKALYENLGGSLKFSTK